MPTFLRLIFLNKRFQLLKSDVLLNVCWSSRMSCLDIWCLEMHNKEAPRVQSRSLFIVISCFGLCTRGEQHKVNHSKKILYSTQQTSDLIHGRFIVTELTAVLVSVRPWRTARRKAKSRDCTSQNNLTVKGTASWVNIIPASREDPP